MVVRSLAAVFSRAREADEIDGLARFLARGGDMAVAQERAGHDIGEHGHGAKGFCDLEGARQAVRADVVRPQADDLLAEGEHRAGIGAVKAGDEMEARGLAGAVRPDQRERLVLLHGEADILHGAQAAEALVEALDDQRVGHGAVLRARRLPVATWRCIASLIKPIKPGRPPQDHRHQDQA